jgi:molybdopterin molybdotransferase
MISFDEAIELVRSVAKPLGTETVRLADSAYRVLAAPVVARIDSPRADVSTMDGYAVRDADLGTFPLSLRVIGESFAGAGWNEAVPEWTCVRIFTGAPIPSGANRVIIQENVRREADFAIIDAHPGPSPNIRKRGSDFAAGEQVLAAGRGLSARAIVAAAAADIAEVEVYRQPRLQILSTGDELAEPGGAHEIANAIPESVSFGVAALAQQWGAICTGRSRLRDDLSAMHSSVAGAIDAADIVVVTGGASVGERDFAKAMFEPLGLDLIFSKVGMKPGKPVWLGRAGEALVMGLPGNPTSAMVTARLLLAPLLAGMRGQPVEAALRWHEAGLASALSECGARETFHRARWIGATVEVLPNQDSGAQRALADAELLVRQRANSPALERGAPVEVLDF